MKQPLAMPCTQEQFEKDIKPSLDKPGIDYQGVTDNWDLYQILVNNLEGNYGRVANVVTSAANDYNRTHIPYNPTLFLESLGIVEKKWEDRTRGGYEYKIIMEDSGNNIYPTIVIAKIRDVWEHYRVTEKGQFLQTELHSKDLIPFNPERAKLLARKSELEKELEEIFKQLTTK